MQRALVYRLFIFAVAASVVTAQSGAIDPAISYVSCGGVSSVVAGYPVVCIATLRTAGGYPWGSDSDVCQFVFSWSNDNNNPGCNTGGFLQNATSLGGGLYRVVFYPIAAGTVSLFATVTNISVSVKPNQIVVYPGPISGYTSTSTCAVSLGITKCTLELKDPFGNVVSTCSEYSSSVTNVAASTCKTLSNPADTYYYY